jgi:hypothetical protein
VRGLRSASTRAGCSALELHTPCPSCGRTAGSSGPPPPSPGTQSSCTAHRRQSPCATPRPPRTWPAPPARPTCAHAGSGTLRGARQRESVKPSRRGLLTAGIVMPNRVEQSLLLDLSSAETCQRHARASTAGWKLPDRSTVQRQIWGKI